jgi:PKHD-type hydroxylase
LWADDGNRIEPTDCAELVGLCMKLPAQKATVGGTGYDPKIRRSEVRWIKHRDDEPTHAEFSEMWDFVERRFKTANRNAFGVDITYTHSMQFTSYYANEEGCFDWHMDTFFSEHNRTREYCLHRKLSMVLQLTDPSQYEGGVLELKANPPPDPELLAKQGAMVVFPSFLQHRVTPVTRGARHVLVCWAEGPFWR